MRDLLLEDAQSFLGLLLLLLGLDVIGVSNAGRDGEVRLEDLALDGVDSLVALLLAIDLAGNDQAVVGKFLDLLGDLVAWSRELAHANSRGAALGAKLFDQLEGRLDAFVVANANRAKHGGLVDFGSADFDHVDAVLVAGQHEVEVAELDLSLGRVDDEALALLSDDATDADGGNRSEVGRIGEVERRRSCGASDHIGVVLAVVRIGRSIIRIVRISFSFGAPSRLRKPPGNLPAAPVFSR